MGPCPDCMKCCCRWIEGLDENECVNFEEFGRCTCEHENDDQAAITTDEESEEFLE